MNNMQRLGDTLTGRMNKTAGAYANRPAIELGTIGSGLSLKTDSNMTIPKGQYMVNLILTAESYKTSSETHTHSGGGHSQETGSGTHSHDGGAHDHNLPNVFRAIRSGDRVLVAWAGNEAVVVAIVKSS